MITTTLYEGSGLSNQIWNYSVLRSIALKNNYEWGIHTPTGFKGQSFLELDFGSKIEDIKAFDTYEERVIRNSYGKDISPHDPYMLNIPDGVHISGCMQSVKYFTGIEDVVKSWIKIRQPYMPSSDNVCVIHLRGGDFLSAGNTLLPRQYYQSAMSWMLKKNSDMLFFVVTDDIEFADYYLPGIRVIGSSIFRQRDESQANHHVGGDVGTDFRILASSRNLIISNSSFSWWATYINPYSPSVIAPWGWAAYNYPDDFWSTAEIKVDQWAYLHKDGGFHD